MLAASLVPRGFALPDPGSKRQIETGRRLIDPMLIPSCPAVNVVFYAALGEDHHCRHGNLPNRNRQPVSFVWEEARPLADESAPEPRFHRPNKFALIGTWMNRSPTHLLFDHL